MVTPAPNTYFPWSDGPQNCPGARFSQVEFVAVLACILRDHRVSIIRRPGESFEQAKERALATTEDCDMELLLRMRDADKVKLACRKV
jgi:cytochrome P450